MAGEKFLQNVGGTMKEVIAVQAATANRIPSLDAGGLIPSDMMPVGVGADTLSIATSETLAAGDLVNVWDNAGAAVRKADATTAGKEANGFVISAFTHPISALVYFEGKITGLTGLTIGAKYYLSTTAGGITTTAPSATNNISQYVGTAVSTTELTFEPAQAITIA